MDVTLVMFKEDGQRRDFALKKDTATLGRNTDCDFQIPLGVVSRRHCQLSVKGDKLVVRDLGSSNGTFVNNKRVQEAQLEAGDTLVIGPVIFTIMIDGEPSEIKALRTVIGPRKAAPAPHPETDDGTVDVEAALGEAVPAEGSGALGAVEADASAQSGENPLAALEAMSKKKKP